MDKLEFTGKHQIVRGGLGSLFTTGWAAAVDYLWREFEEQQAIIAAYDSALESAWEDIERISGVLDVTAARVRELQWERNKITADWMHIAEERAKLLAALKEAQCAPSWEDVVHIIVEAIRSAEDPCESCFHSDAGDCMVGREKCMGVEGSDE